MALIATRHIGTGGPGRPLLVLGPSLGTTATRLWGRCIDLLTPRFDVLAWDLPGHGAAPPASGFDLADLATEVADAIRARSAGHVVYAGDSVGAAVGLAVLLDHPGLVGGAVLACTGARIGTPDHWAERARAVGFSGMEVVRAAAAGRWFAPGFADREPATVSTLLEDLGAVEPVGYAAVCHALARFDVRDSLAGVDVPVTAVAGRHDTVTPVDSMRDLVSGLRQGHLVVLDDVAHLAAVEAPRTVAALIGAHTTAGVEEGMAVRRAVLGDDHVDRATRARTALTNDFQEFITRYAWGEIWTRPGLDRRSRSLITITALVAHGHLEELALHLRAALRNGLSTAEISETLMQTAVYCGVPAANSAFRVAADVLADEVAPTGVPVGDGGPAPVPPESLAP